MCGRTLVYVELDRLPRAEIATHVLRVARLCVPTGSHIVEHADAGFAIIASSSRDAIKTAFTIAGVTAAAPISLALRIGLDTSDHDTTTHVAATARWGEIVATESIAELAVEHALGTAVPIGTFRLGAFREPAALFVLRNRVAEADQLIYLDAVCGRGVLASEAVAHTHYEGATLRFCSWPCADAFDQSPEHFLVRTTRGPGPQETSRGSMERTT